MSDELYSKYSNIKCLLQRQILHQLSNQRTDNNNINEEERGDTNENTIENEAVVQLYSPPSYNSLKETCMGEEDLNKCLEKLKNSTLPPSYSCVMSHQDVFHLSYTDLRKLKQAANKKVALSETDVHLLGS